MGLPVNGYNQILFSRNPKPDENKMLISNRNSIDVYLCQNNLITRDVGGIRPGSKIKIHSSRCSEISVICTPIDEVYREIAQAVPEMGRWKNTIASGY